MTKVVPVNKFSKIMPKDERLNPKQQKTAIKWDKFKGLHTNFNAMDRSILSKEAFHCVPLWMLGSIANAWHMNRCFEDNNMNNGKTIEINE